MPLTLVYVRLAVALLVLPCAIAAVYFTLRKRGRSADIASAYTFALLAISFSISPSGVQPRWLAIAVPILCTAVAVMYLLRLAGVLPRTPYDY